MCILTSALISLLVYIAIVYFLLFRSTEIESNANVVGLLKNLKWMEQDTKSEGVYILVDKWTLWLAAFARLPGGEHILLSVSIFIF